MKAFNIIFCVLFIIAAALQYNDPDPYIWVPIYLYSAGLCFLAAREKYFPKAYLIGIVLYLIYAVYLFFDKTGVLNWATDHQAENIAQSMKATKPWIEETREFFGLLIAVIVLFINLVYSKRSFAKDKQDSQLAPNG
jgi:hypothetical protein